MAEGLPLAFAALPDMAGAAAPGAAAGVAVHLLAPAPALAAPSLLAIDLSGCGRGPCAGSCCARRAACHQVKVRHDGARAADIARLFDLLNAGKESLVLDFDDKSHRTGLRKLIEAADIVISSGAAARHRPIGPESARTDPRPAWTHLDRHHGTWLAWPCRATCGFRRRCGRGGRTGGNGRRRPTGIHGDAIADPLTGLSAASAALLCAPAGRRRGFMTSACAAAQSVSPARAA